ncbi:hypothetical protein EDD15DRAFT_2265839 [Pisolithus albus]|nr:hypothetical protein EDD15DRAFT_2265839 [Pisolithus albus]
MFPSSLLLCLTCSTFSSFPRPTRSFFCLPLSLLGFLGFPLSPLDRSPVRFRFVRMTYIRIAARVEPRRSLPVMRK